MHLLATAPPEAFAQVEDQIGRRRAQLSDERRDIRTQRHQLRDLAEFAQSAGHRLRFVLGALLGNAVESLALRRFLHSPVKADRDFHCTPLVRAG